MYEIPNNAVSSASGITWLDKTGIIIAVAKDHVIHTLENARENHNLNALLANGIRRPFLIDMTETKLMSQEARTFYAGPEPAKVLTAVAILSNSSNATLIGNMYLTLTKQTLPTKLFDDYNKAVKWLKQYTLPEG